MSDFEVEVLRDFTVIKNHVFKNKNLSRKAMGLLAQMLSLPPGWDYSERGLAAIGKDKLSSVKTAIKELEDAGYIVRVQNRDEKGRMGKNKYRVFHEPKKNP